MDNDTKPKQQISTASAIIVAGFLIMVGIILTKTSNVKPAPKTLSEQVGVSKADLDACIKSTDTTALNNSINDSVDKAMVNVSQRGTPYSVVIGINDVKTEILGAESYDNVKKIVNDALIGKVTKAYTGNVPPPTASDHIYGNPNAPVTIIEYADFECPYCKQFHPILKQIVDESNNNVRWIYRHFPIHQHSFEELVAAECVAKLKGNDAFWKYGDLLFGLLNPEQNSISNQL
ncbi:MAG: thioredoxin domain-containing protein [Patescibacteria group bacterium]|nr:thioredoxin domain-containing protein [Patescibacteria group bacterium]